jgi:hypothetical protein
VSSARDRTTGRAAAGGNRERKRDVEESAGDAVLGLQEAAGNSAVAGLLGRAGDRGLLRGGETAGATAVAEPGEEAKPADAKEILAKEAPHLARVLDEQQVAGVQKLLDARFARKWLAERRDREYEEHEIDYVLGRGGWMTSDRKPGLERLLRKIDSVDRVIAANSTLWVDTALLLSDDVQTGGVSDNPADSAFRDGMYKRLAALPTKVEIGEEPGIVSGRFRLFWGPADWQLGHDGGLITWRSLMAVERWNLEYQSVLLGEQAKILEAMSDIARDVGGASYDLYGKKVGELWGYVWNDDVEVGGELGKLGGYYDDTSGELEAMHVLWDHPGAGFIAVAPDGWLHAYALRPSVTSWIHLTNPFRNHDYVYLLHDGCEVPDIRRVLTKDKVDLEWDPDGWRTKEDPDQMSSFEQFAVGAIFGDFFEEDSSSALFGQIFTGVIPIVGQIGDARDTAAGVAKMWESGGKDGKLQTALALVGFVPLIGDYVKNARKGGKIAAETLQESIPEMTQAYARKIAADPAAAATFFGASVKAAREAAEEGASAVGRALEAGGEAATALANEARAILDAAGGNVAYLVARYGGDWAPLAKALNADPTGVGKALGETMQAWRESEMTALRAGLESSTKELEGHMGRALGKPEFTATGSKGPMSDVDLNFVGPDASAFRAAAERFLTERYGLASWAETRRFLNVGAFTDPARLHMYTEVGEALGTKGVAKIEKALVAESELNVLAKMIREGASETEVRGFEKKIGVEFDDVTARVREIDELAADPLAVHKLELRMDVLHKRFETLKATDPTAAGAVAAEMATIQGKLNTLVSDAYVTPGAAYKHVGLREPSLRAGIELEPGKVLMTPAMRYMAVLDDMQMLSHTLGAAKAAGRFTADAAKDMAKYSQRLVVTAGQLGAIDVAKAADARIIFYQVDGLFGAAKKAPAHVARTAQGYLDEARKLLEEQLDEILEKGKTLSKDASVPAAYRKTTAETMDTLRLQLELIRGTALVWRVTLPADDPAAAGEEE